MSDLISRQAAIDALKKEQSLVERPITETRWFDLGLMKAQEVLSELPSVDAVQVVRCGECRYWWGESEQCLDEIGFARKWKADDYCSNGERLEE